MQADSIRLRKSIVKILPTESAEIVGSAAQDEIEGSTSAGNNVDDNAAAIDDNAAAIARAGHADGGFKNSRLAISDKCTSSRSQDAVQYSGVVRQRAGGAIIMTVNDDVEEELEGLVSECVAGAVDGEEAGKKLK